MKFDYDELRILRRALYHYKGILSDKLLNSEKNENNQDKFTVARLDLKKVNILLDRIEQERNFD